MNLYTNGCSFTWGHNHTGLEKTYQAYGFRYGNSSPIRDFDPTVWPLQLEQHFNQLFNHADPGTGAGRLCRTTLEFLSHIPVEELSEWIMILQLSQPGRLEFLTDQQSEVVGTQPGLALTHLLDDPNAQITTDDLQVQTYGQFSLCISDNHQFLEQFKNLYILVSELEKKGVKYLITGMDPRCYGRGTNANPLVSHTQNLWGSIPDHNIVHTMTEILKAHDWQDVHDPCGHPNELGHQYVANYILHELKTRGYLNEQ